MPRMWKISGWLPHRHIPEDDDGNDSDDDNKGCGGRSVDRCPSDKYQKMTMVATVMMITKVVVEDQWIAVRQTNTRRWR